MKKILTFLLLSLLSNLTFAETTIYLVRHAEKEPSKEIKDPELTAIGKFRAENIAKQLSKIGITAVYSTNYKRTMLTAKPMAKLMGLEIQQYDASKLVEFSNEVKSMQGTILIVGHSNTTPKLTSLISGQIVDPIGEHEFDNLYQIILTESQTIFNRFKTIPSFEFTATKSNIGKTKVSHLESTK